MWIALSIVFFLISVVTTTLLYFSLKRINQFEIYLNRIQGIIDYSSEKMKQVDSLGHYEADDETGFFFEEIKKIQNILDNLFELEDNTDAKK
tara:strand:- start:1518 stop:1793 length:276 start_codon:yes stop_codon:yes gene_type:complete